MQNDGGVNLVDKTDRDRAAAKELSIAKRKRIRGIVIFGIVAVMIGLVIVSCIPESPARQVERITSVKLPREARNVFHYNDSGWHKSDIYSVFEFKERPVDFLEQHLFNDIRLSLSHEELIVGIANGAKAPSELHPSWHETYIRTELQGTNSTTYGFIYFSEPLRLIFFRKAYN